MSATVFQRPVPEEARLCSVRQIGTSNLSMLLYNGFKTSLLITTAVVPELGGPGGPLAPPIFGRSVNPIPTGGGQIMPTISTGPPQSFSPSGITALKSAFIL